MLQFSLRLKISSHTCLAIPTNQCAIGTFVLSPLIVSGIYRVVELVEL